MGRSVPTPEELTAAQTYALSKLCLDIPEKYGSKNLTKWDEDKKVCRITYKGCQTDDLNPLTQKAFDVAGNAIEYDKHHRAFGKFWEKYPPGFNAWRVTDKSDNVEVCAPSNYLMQQWCESPQSRGMGENIPGVTDSVPFKWKIINGKEVCEIPKSYCDSKGVSYKNGDCEVKDSQKVSEFFLGSVFVRERKAKAASDKRLKSHVTLVRKDFPVKGVNVYVFMWNDIATTLYGYSGWDVGFIADELDPKYINEDVHGYKIINLEYEDDTMKNIYAFLKIKNIFIQ